MASSDQTKITNRLKTLEELHSGISVKVTGPSRGTIHIQHKKHHGLEFYFHWVPPGHFIGHFKDSNGAQSQAVVSLYTPMHAIWFVSAYCMLDMMRSKTKKK